MPNNLKFQEGQVPIDSNLRPVKVDDIPSALELSTDKVRVKVLEIIDELETLRVGSIVTEGDAINFYRQLAHLATFENNTIKFHSGTADVFELATSLSKLIIRDILNTSDYFQIDTGTNGATTISTVDDDAEAAHLTLDVDGDIILDSHTGEFIAKKAGTEFSAANSAYAGMILGFTEIFDDSISGEDTFQATTTSFVNLSLTQGGGEKRLQVSFVVPPSNKVLIKVHLPYCANIDGTFILGLATDTSATTLHEDYERRVWDVDESDTVGIHYQWVIHGSDHSWSAGESKTLYVMAKESSAGGRIYSGDGAFANYGAWTMEAVALPVTIADGS